MAEKRFELFERLERLELFNPIYCFNIFTSSSFNLAPPPLR